MKPANILIKPLITEKTTQKQLSNRVVFKVANNVNKYQIKQAVQTLFSVTVIKVHTINVPGKTRRLGRKRLKSTSPGWKKAVVYLKDSDKIDLFKVKPAKESWSVKK